MNDIKNWIFYPFKVFYVIVFLTKIHFSLLFFLTFKYPLIKL